MAYSFHRPSKCTSVLQYAEPLARRGQQHAQALVILKPTILVYTLRNEGVATEHTFCRVDRHEHRKEWQPAALPARIMRTPLFFRYYCQSSTLLTLLPPVLHVCTPMQYMLSDWSIAKDDRGSKSAGFM